MKTKSKSKNQSFLSNLIEKSIHLIKSLVFGYNEKLKIKVINHSPKICSDFWCIFYSMPGYTRKWNRLEECYTLCNSYNLLQSDFPVLLNYNQAVEKAKNLTVESINNHNKKELKKYESELIRILGCNSRDKIWKNY